MRVSTVGLGGMLLATATHTTSARTCGDKSPLDAKCADLFPTCPDRHSPAIFNGCYHCAHDVTCVIKSFAVVNVKEMVQANEENDGDDVKDESAAAKSAGDKDRQVWSEAGSHLNAVTATTTESTTGWAVLSVLALLGVGVAVGGIYRHTRSRGQYHSILSQQQHQYDTDDAALDDLNPFCHGGVNEETPSLLKPTPNVPSTPLPFRIMTA
ncbi:hypothetical protein H310_11100 [Aphanomyces invadans]|uniref:Uncharacterized protein n=1 Tax=Aphanomyces invadans TaxID=157072 RepID=A0A024TNV0_9STRA|nr:hypothetical protein H310_11100 [Aphanomyces invadans]ETV95684.1 hypothetical protein H310_11100 [Aphanomyces invadans]|eukprot:XP_008875877.1 hypothetical protein H310_11100 [Aphanomyces invadans]